jgi:alcohol dehydrogenase (cytochrome c)
MHQTRARWGAAAGLALLTMAAPALAQAPAAAPPPAERFPGVVNHDAVYQGETARRADKLAKLTPVTDQTLKAPASGDWLMWRRAYDGQGFSPLKQINRKTAAALAPAWTWTLPVSPNEITPVVHEGVLFIASGGRVQALDGATGDLLWQYVRPPTPGFGAAGTVLRNIALYDDKVLVPTPDRHMVALDMRTGKVVWDHEIVPASEPGPRLSGGPMVAHGKVIQGVSSCNAVKGGCWIVALDARTGNEVWRFYTIARPGQPGGDSWNGAPLDERFGGSVWTAGSYDPDLNLLYYGVGQTYDTATLLLPHAQKGESADGLYTDSTLALDPDTGRLVWHYQHFNGDVWDYDWAFERTLVDLEVDGARRKLAVTAGKLAIFDALDRGTGRYLFSKDLGLQTLVKSVDPVTGKKLIDPALAPQAGVTKTICPHPGGIRSWLATSYDPATRMIYVPMVESCMDFTWKPRDAAETAAGGSDLGWVVKAPSGSDGKFGRVEAIDLQTRKVAWIRRQRAPESSSMLATAGEVVFEGSRDRMFRASDSRTGKVLWSIRLNAAPSSTPVTYSIGGRQYVAVVAGGGGAHDVTWPTLTPEIDSPAGGTTLWVFKLPAMAPTKAG